MGFILLFVFIISFCPTVFAYSGGCSADTAILFQSDTNTVLYEKNAYDSKLVASTTKIMTALVALENSSPDDIVDIRSEYTEIEGSSMYLKAGERFKVKELIYGLMLMSGNDAAVALACHVADSVEAFAALMSEKAYELGCLNTNFENPHGLDADKHYSCAYDLALIMKAAMQNDSFAEITSTKEIIIAGRSMKNHNKLLWNCDGCVGGKTGYTKKAGRTLVSVCNRDGMELICVTISDKDDWNDHMTLYDWGYSNNELIDLSQDFTIPVISGTKNEVKVFCEQKYFMLKKKPYEIHYDLPELVYAPVSIGDCVGCVNVITEDEVYKYQIISTENIDIDETIKLSFWERIKWSWYYYNDHSGQVQFIPRY